jgi:hypothetical protein
MKALLLTMLVLTVGVTATAQTSVFVPGNATGCFGNPSEGCQPFVAAITVSGPGAITVTYTSGLVTWRLGSTAGPDGASCNPCGPQQLPLNESRSVGLVSNSTRVAALIGVFVPQYRVRRSGFQALDGTKNITHVGIKPQFLFFVGTGITFTANEAGTLFLGINDSTANDNSGGFNVTVSGP